MKMEQSVPKHWHTYSPMKMEQTECSKTLAYPLAYEDGADRVFRNFGTPTRLWRWNRQCVPKHWHTYSPMKMEQTECSETLAHLLAYEDGTDSVFRNIGVPTRLWRWDRVFRNIGIPTRIWRWNRQSVPKRWHLNYRRRWITQKKAYDIQNMVKFWNQECYLF
jgi:hypothetical protein